MVASGCWGGPVGVAYDQAGLGYDPVYAAVAASPAQVTGVGRDAGHTVRWRVINEGGLGDGLPG